MKKFPCPVNWIIIPQKLPISYVVYEWYIGYVPYEILGRNPDLKDAVYVSKSFGKPIQYAKVGIYDGHPNVRINKKDDTV
jgi:hypothetical protein